MIIARPLADLAKSGSPVEAAGGRIARIHFKKHGLATEAGQAPKMKIKQHSRKFPSSPCRGDSE